MVGGAMMACCDFMGSDQGGSSGTTYDETTPIEDSSSNELIEFAKTASAVNHVSVTNAATGNGPTIAAAGGDTNIDLLLSGKGTGGVECPGQIRANLGHTTAANVALAIEDVNTGFFTKSSPASHIFVSVLGQEAIEFANGYVWSKVYHAFSDHIYFEQSSAPGTSGSRAYIWNQDNGGTTELKATCGTGGVEVLLCDESGNMGVLSGTQKLYYSGTTSYFETSAGFVEQYVSGTRVARWRNDQLQIERRLMMANGMAVTMLEDQTGTINCDQDTTEAFIGADTGTGTLTVNLPSAPASGVLYRVMDTGGNSSVNNITINRGGADTVGTAGATSLTISTNSAGYELVYDSTNNNWLVTAKNLL